jgi:hypothetical protein
VGSRVLDKENEMNTVFYFRRSYSGNIPFSEDPEEHDRIKNELFGIICQKFKELYCRGGMRPGDTLEMHLELNESFVGS